MTLPDCTHLPSEEDRNAPLPDTDENGITAHRCSHGNGFGPIDRRTVLKTGATLLATASAGCLGGSEGSGDVPTPVTIESGAQCDVCGMVIANHPGPNGQLFYRDNSPATHDNPAWFDALQACFFPYYFEKDRLDWTLAVGYVTDYSAVEYDIQESGGETYISSHTDAASFTDATAVSYVVGSDVHGAMGPDFIPYSEAGDAESFATDHGGEVLGFDDIGPELLGR